MKVALVASLSVTFLFAPSILSAATPLFDGDFESGTFQGWAPAGTGSAIVATRGTCFSSNDTTELSIRDNFAGLLRGVNGKKEDLPSLTSRSFVAGSGVAFLALSEWRAKKTLKREEQHPLALTVTLLDGAGKTLRTHEMATAMAELSGGCPSSPSDASFRPLYVDTRAYAGKPIKIRFTQHLDTAISGAFTLIDEVVATGIDEVPIYRSYPFAIAGVGRTSNGTLMLEPEQPASGTPSDWQFSWYINGESARRPYFNPCLDDLDEGEYTATLYVRVNHVLNTDTIRFIVPKQDQTESTSVASTSSTATSTTASTSLSTSTTDSLCNASHPSELQNTTDSGTDSGDDGSEETDGTDTTETASSPTLTISVENSIEVGKEVYFLNDVNIAPGTTSGSSDIFASGTIKFTQSGEGDKLIAPDSSDIDAALTAECDTTNKTCTIETTSGTVDDSPYETAFEQFKIILDSGQATAFSISIVDGNGKSASDTGGFGAVNPVILATTATPFTAESSESAYTELNVTTLNDKKLSSASVVISPELSGDELTASSTTSPAAVCDTSFTCKWEGADTVSAYETAIKTLQVNLSNVDQKRVLTITITDEDNRISTSDNIINIE